MELGVLEGYFFSSFPSSNFQLFFRIRGMIRVEQPTLVATSEVYVQLMLRVAPLWAQPSYGEAQLETQQNVWAHSTVFKFSLKTTGWQPWGGCSKVAFLFTPWYILLRQLLRSVLSQQIYKHRQISVVCFVNLNGLCPFGIFFFCEYNSSNNFREFLQVFNNASWRMHSQNVDSHGSGTTALS